jgi:serine-type D-Ala-D-Ala carboxypeptidase
MNGVAGHAGLFGSVGGVLAIARAWLERRLPGVPAWAQAPLWGLFSTPSSVPESTRRRGFDGPAPDGSGSTGTALPSSAIGHLGFTGTSVWIDPERQAIYVLLSNRVHPNRHDQRIRALRQRFHHLAAAL